MTNLRQENYDNNIFKDLNIDCEKCFGLCCVALYFSKSDGFPKDKEAGKPCMNLEENFRCSVHKDLKKRGLKGCTTYDCFGAGQKVSQVTYKGNSWRDLNNIANEMFDVFVVMRQLHEMLWYLTDASTFKLPKLIRDETSLIIKETKVLTELDAKSILNIDITKHRMRVNFVLKKVFEVVKQNNLYKQNENLSSKRKLSQKFDFIGENLTNINLVGANLSGALLIATNLSNTDLSGANLIGADLRDANIKGANLENSIFITQVQVNSAKGDLKTKLPKSLKRPSYWE